MARRDEFDRVLSTTFGAVVLLFLGFGLLVYACFGEATGRALDLAYISPTSPLYLPIYRAGHGARAHDQPCT